MKLTMKYCMLGALLLISICASAQQAVSDAESKRMIAQIGEAASKVAAMQCDFRQVKQMSLLKTEMVSTGKMHYKGGKLLRWEYVSPYSYIFILNDDKVIMKTDEKTDVVSVKSSKLFRQIARVMMNSITGKCLSDAEDFSVSMYKAEGKWMARLVPKQKDMAQFFSQVHLYFDPKLEMVTVVEMIEKGGDVTRITMDNVKKNVTIQDDMFTVK